jgi:hypothetical protein
MPSLSMTLFPGWLGPQGADTPSYQQVKRFGKESVATGHPETARPTRLAFPPPPRHLTAGADKG